MKVFVTGATGLVGAHTALCLHQRGHSLRLLVRDVAKAKRWFEQFAVDIDDYVEADMTDLASVEAAMQGCDAVVHAAAMVDLDTRHRQQTERINVSGLQNVVGTACKSGISKILYVSSTSAMFNYATDRIDENSPLMHSKDPYSHSKTLCERQVREWQEQGFPIISTYPTGVLGPFDPKLAQSNEGLLLLYRDLMPMTSSGMQFVDARDIGKAHALLLEKPLQADKTHERYIIGGHYLSWPAFADSLDSLGKKKIRRIPMPGALFRGLGYLFDVVRKLVPIAYPISYESALIVTKMPYSSSQKLLDTVDMQFTDYHKTFADTIAWFEDSGHL